MQKRAIFVVAIVAVISLMAYPAFAGGPTKPSGKSDVGQLYLVEKNPVDWTVVEGGAWGKMTYSTVGPSFDFVFNGHGLLPEVEYCLIYYPDPWPGNDLVCLACGFPNNGGNLNLQESIECGDSVEGAKIWLVLADDVDCDNRLMVAWNPSYYLFEYNLIDFECTAE